MTSAGDESAIVRRAADGDERAFRALVEQHAPAILALAVSRLRDPVVAEEVAQDVFVKLFRSLPDFRGESALRTWLVRVTLNRCADALRHQIRMKRNVPLDDVAHTLTNDGEVTHVGGDADRVRDAVDALPPMQRTIVQLKYDAGLSYEQISGTLGIPVGTVGSRLTAALKGLRALLTLPHAKS
jgi:RNA polymerase sigma-70 factor (ECF subfamily)